MAERNNNTSQEEGVLEEEMKKMEHDVTVASIKAIGLKELTNHPRFGELEKRINDVSEKHQIEELSLQELLESEEFLKMVELLQEIEACGTQELKNEFERISKFSIAWLGKMNLNKERIIEKFKEVKKKKKEEDEKETKEEDEKVETKGERVGEEIFEFTTER